MAIIRKSSQAENEDRNDGANLQSNWLWVSLDGTTTYATQHEIRSYIQAK